MERKRICFTSPGVAELVDENVAEIAEDEALIKTEYSAISAGTEFANLVGEPNIQVEINGQRGAVIPPLAELLPWGKGLPNSMLVTV